MTRLWALYMLALVPFTTASNSNPEELTPNRRHTTRVFLLIVSVHETIKNLSRYLRPHSALQALSDPGFIFP
jgi:hypothetical protein